MELIDEYKYLSVRLLTILSMEDDEEIDVDVILDILNKRQEIIDKFKEMSDKEELKDKLVEVGIIELEGIIQGKIIELMEKKMGKVIEVKNQINAIKKYNAREDIDPMFISNKY